jgi:hypothetical protein
MATANGQSLHGSWVTIKDRAAVAEVAFIGVVTVVEMGHYGNQLATTYSAWREQGVSLISLLHLPELRTIISVLK